MIKLCNSSPYLRRFNVSSLSVISFSLEHLLMLLSMFHNLHPWNSTLHKNIFISFILVFMFIFFAISNFVSLKKIYLTCPVLHLIWFFDFLSSVKMVPKYLKIFLLLGDFLRVEYFKIYLLKYQLDSLSQQ